MIKFYHYGFNQFVLQDVYWVLENENENFKLIPLVLAKNENGQNCITILTDENSINSTYIPFIVKNKDVKSNIEYSISLFENNVQNKSNATSKISGTDLSLNEKEKCNHKMEILTTIELWGRYVSHTQNAGKGELGVLLSRVYKKYEIPKLVKFIKELMSKTNEYLL